jgi:predicted negative regulator of RcsB-dependent stress response
VCALAFSGWQGWQYWQSRQALEASTLYETLSKAVRENDAKGVRDASGALLENYSGTAYAPMGALTSAKYFFDRGDLKGAKAQLQWVVDKTGSDELRESRRPAAVLDEKSHDEALGCRPQHTEARGAATRGDACGEEPGRRSPGRAKLAIEKAGTKSASCATACRCPDARQLSMITTRRAAACPPASPPLSACSPTSGYMPSMNPMEWFLQRLKGPGLSNYADRQPQAAHAGRPAGSAGVFVFSPNCR